MSNDGVLSLEKMNFLRKHVLRAEVLQDGSHSHFYLLILTRNSVFALGTLFPVLVMKYPTANLLYDFSISLN